MRVAVAGAGRMGATHAALLAGIEEVDELLVIDADPERAASVAEATGGRAVTLEAALDAADALVVATPADAHAATVDAAVARHMPVLCEKPLTHDLASSIELTRRVEEAGAHVEVAFQRRHDPGFAAARGQVAGGSIGRVHLLRLTAFDPRVTSRLASEWPQGDAAPLFLHSSIHDFDFARWMTGQEVLEVRADGSRHDDPRPDDARGIESAVVTMRLSDGALAVLEATWLHPAGYDVRAELVADRAHLTMGLSGRTPAQHLDWAAADGGPAVAWGGYLQRFEPAYRAELAAFLAAARGERPPASTARDGVEAMRVAVAATRSYVERRAVALSEIDGATSARARVA